MATAAPPDSGAVPRGGRPESGAIAAPGTSNGGGSVVVGNNPQHAQLKSAAGNHSKSVVVPPIGVSASVGHDHWANDVLSAVQDHREAEQPPRAGPSPTASASAAAASADRGVRSVKDLILEKKRKFHSGRMLELKNLPDGCTEQVGKLNNVYDIF